MRSASEIAALDLPWAARRDDGYADHAVFDCFGKQVATGLRRIDAEAIVERMNALLETPAQAA